MKEITEEDFNEAYGAVKLYIAKDTSHAGALRLATIWHLEQVKLLKNQITNLQHELANIVCENPPI